jgi:hypothetical protein
LFESTATFYIEGTQNETNDIEADFTGAAGSKMRDKNNFLIGTEKSERLLKNFFGTHFVPGVPR